MARARAAMRHWQVMLARSRLWASCALLTVLFTVIGPFGTADGPDPQARFAFWGSVLIAGWLLATLHIAVVGQLAPRRWPPALVASVGGAAAAPAISALARVLSQGLFGHPFDGWAWAADLPLCCTVAAAVSLLARLTSPVDMPGRALAAAPIPVPVGDAAPRPGAAGAAQAIPRDAAPAAESLPPLLARLPPAKRGPLVRLSMQDHYVQIVTDAGSEVVLLRMSDALAEVAPEPGLQVHRSHWVARRALRGVRRDRGRLWLRLADGSETPVARTRVDALRDAGWLSAPEPRPASGPQEPPNAT